MFLAFLGLATFAVIEYIKVGSLTQELDALKARPRAAVAQAAVARPTGTQIICPVCHGEKVIVYNPTGTNNPLYRKTQTCPVCLGVGYRVLTIPPGQKICPDCQGMGLVYLRASNGAVTASNCERCGATGLVAAVK
jgi:DnaJ-class molecular chaperone